MPQRRRRIVEMAAELLPHKGGFYLWHYVPSLAAALLFAILFLLLTILYIWKVYRTRMWFCIPFVVGGIMEVIGYFARAKAHNETDRLFPYIIQNVFLLLPPVLFAATVYMTLSRIIKAARGEAYTLLPARLITKTFVWSDVISFLVQGGGAGMMATGTSLANTGQWIVVGGLLIQILMFGFFIVISTVFHHRYKTRSVRAVVDPGYVWKAVLYMVYCVSTLIMIRSIYRVCEFVSGQDGYMMSHEWVLYVFDSVTMFIVMVIFYLRFPDKLGDEISKGERVNSLELFSTGPSAGVVQRDCSTEGPKYQRE